MKLQMEKYKAVGTLLVAGILVASCGGGNETEGGLPGSGAVGGVGNPGYNPPKTIVITSPFSDAIENLGEGVYRRRFTVIVEDKEGNAVADGTKVNLNVIDTIKAMGIIEAGTDSISGSTLRDAIPYSGDSYTPTTFTSAVVNRRGTSFVIAPGDHLILLNADKADKARIVSSISANSVTTRAPFANSYPNPLYPGNVPVTPPTMSNPLSPENESISNTYYYIGASKNGAYVVGADGTKGETTTTKGQGEFYVVYPSDTDYILNGCTDDVDPRTVPAGATGTFIIASVASDTGVTDVQRTCFSPIAGATLVSDLESISSGTSTITLTVRDGGDKTFLPYLAVVLKLSDPNNIVTSLSMTPVPGRVNYFYGFTDAQGNLDVTVTITPPGTPGTSAAATLNFSAAGASAQVGAVATTP